MSKIVDTICEAWQTKNPELLYEILTDDFKWYDSPFEEVITDKQGLVERWKLDTDAQENITVKSEIISENDEKEIAHWRAEFDRNGGHDVLDGVFVIKKNDEKLSEFRMWWVSKR